MRLGEDGLSIVYGSLCSDPSLTRFQVEQIRYLVVQLDQSRHWRVARVIAEASKAILLFQVCPPI